MHEEIQLEGIVKRLAKLEQENAELKQYIMGSWSAGQGGAGAASAGVSALDEPVVAAAPRMDRRGALRAGLGVVAATVAASAVFDVNSGSAAATSLPSVPAGSIYLLPVPVRLFDSRAYPGRPLYAGETYTLQVTGPYVPAGAKGVVGNVTAVQPGGSGLILVYAAALTRPSVSTLNFDHQNVANAVLTRLNDHGRIDIYVEGSPTYVLFDVSAYIE